jgi:hypothetical protein
VGNFAALVAPLSISGSRLPDGSPNASGTVWLFQPGTSTPVNGYSDAAATAIVTQPLTLTDGGLLNTADLPGGLFVTQPVRLYIADADGNSVSDTTYIPATAGDVGVDNDATTATTLDQWITQAQTSTGGTNFNYLESGGATPRPIDDKFRELGISVIDFGADPTGIGVSTTAIQQAINRAKVLSTSVLFPAGVYKIDQALTLSSATGVKLIGAGQSATTISQTHATANCFTLSSCTGCSVQGMTIAHATTTTGACVSLSACAATLVTGITTVGDYLIGVSSTGAASKFVLFNNSISTYADAAARAISLSDAGNVSILSNFLSVTTGYAIEFLGSTSDVSVVGNNITTGGIRFNANVTGTAFSIVGNTIFPTGALSFGVATLPGFYYQEGNGRYGATADVASAGTFTPDLSLGRHFRVRATSTGSAITIAAPTPTPATTQYGLTIILDIFNNAGGALSNPYTMNAVYRLATVPNQTDLNHNVYTLVWDPVASVWRQVSLSVTT